MKFILTGITGNIGYEVAKVLLEQGHRVVPIVRTHDSSNSLEKIHDLHSDFSRITEYVDADLEKEIPQYQLEGIDSIIHCAGVVHFRKAGNSNELMMQNLLSFANNSNTPIFYVSTAYLYKPHDEPLYNQYEIDKQQAEDILKKSLLPHTILRPSIVTGNSETGGIINFSGYYLSVPMFLKAFKNSEKVRFPSIKNQVNIIPVDWVAESIVEAICKNQTGTLYVTNQNPPTCDEILTDTLKYFGLEQNWEKINVSFEEYRNMELSGAEKKLLNSYTPFIPYITTAYNFPQSVCERRLEKNYIEKLLKYFCNSKNLYEK